MENMTDRSGLTEEVIEALGAPISPDLVKVNDFNRRQPDYEYVDRQTIIAQANKIFEFDGWSYRIVGDVRFTETPPREKKDNTGEIEEIRQGFYMAVVSLNVRGVGSRDGVGTWNIADDSPKSHDTAAAGAVTKALKRAFATFGPQFGGELRSKSGRRGRTRPPGGSHVPGGTSEVNVVRRIGGARTVKEWIDRNPDMTVPKACEIMGIASLSDRDVDGFMSRRGISDIDLLPGDLDKLPAA